MRFLAIYDRTTKILSALVCVGLLSLAAVVQSLPVAGLAAAVLLFAYVFSPRGYALNGDSIEVERPIGNVQIPLRGLREARRITPDDLRGCIRLFGSGGLFGYYGLFRTTRLGKSRWYVTDRSRAVVVRTADQVFVLSPDEPDVLLQSLHAQAPVGEGQTAFSQTTGSARPSNWAAKIAGVLGIAAGAVAVCFAMLYAPGPPDYTLTRDALTIHDRFYPVTLKADGVAISQMRVVDLGIDTEWRPALRTNGFSNRHYHSGWYQVAGGQKVRLYQADGRRLVLLPPRGAGTPVLVEVLEPDRFITQVRQEWAGGS